jgi:ERF superfamily
MPRSSETVAALASALAKAQAELVNPEKSLTATIRTGRPGDGERSFRYAPLSSGLDIVRKTLGQHEIATLQTTAIDQTAGMVNLTTTLAHASGEWIASDWPVCPIAETANPQRMGAALTYARRYALFTLVGIAGEDDLDAPDLCEGARSQTSSADERPLMPRDGQPRVPPRKPGNGQRRNRMHGERPAPLEPEQSAALREELLTELGTITSADLAAIWAQEALTAKNNLTAADAKLVEDAFERRLSELAPSPTAEAAADAAPSAHVDPAGAHATPAKGNGDPDRPDGINKSALLLARPRRYRNREHLRYVAQQACLICGRKQSDSHHLRYLQPRALGRKASDEFAVPLCRSHHRAVHRAGDEQAWWKAAGIDPVKVARQLWRQTRLNDPQEHHPADLAARPRWSRGWTRLPKAERTTIERRERDGRPSQRPLGSLTQATALALPI